MPEGGEGEARRGSRAARGWVVVPVAEGGRWQGPSRLGPLVPWYSAKYYNDLYSGGRSTRSTRVPLSVKVVPCPLRGLRGNPLRQNQWKPGA